MKINAKHEMLAQISQRGLLLIALIATVLICANPGRAQSNDTAGSTKDAKPVAANAVSAQTPAAAQAKAPVSPEEKRAAKGTKEGIVVHGHWTIVVKNPDGTVAARQEFENALDPFEGADLLTGLLSGEYVADGFLIDLSSGGTILLGGSAGVICGASDCLLYDSRLPQLCAGFGSFQQNSCGTLIYTANTGTANNNAIGFTLSGNVTLNKNDNGTIIVVGAGIVGCYPSSSLTENHLTGNSTGITTGYGTTFSSNITNAAAGTSFITIRPGQIASGNGACSPPANGNALVASNLLLTSRSISQPVTGGQSVAVTVVITFSGS